MPVAVAQPNMPQQEDPLDKLAKVLGIAKAGFGIAADMSTLQEAKARRAEEDKLRGLQIQDMERKNTQAAEDDNPNSPLMAAIRAQAQKRGLTIPENTTPRQARTMFDAFLKPKEEKVRDPLAEQTALARLEEIKDRKADREEKKHGLVREVEDRRQNIKYNIAKLKKMIEDDGTWEMVGSHNQDLDRLVDAIATDTAKLQDPSSVARPNEVDMVKRNLIESGFKNSNATALSILDSFDKEIDERANIAYKVRGLPLPAETQQGVQAQGQAQVPQDMQARAKAILEKRRKDARR